MEVYILNDEIRWNQRDLTFDPSLSVSASWCSLNTKSITAHNASIYKIIVHYSHRQILTLKPFLTIQSIRNTKFLQKFIDKNQIGVLKVISKIHSHVLFSN